jgi:hypothetical protein
MWLVVSINNILSSVGVQIGVLQDNIEKAGLYGDADDEVAKKYFQWTKDTGRELSLKLEDYADAGGEYRVTLLILEQDEPIYKFGTVALKWRSDLEDYMST